MPQPKTDREAELARVKKHYAQLLGVTVQLMKTLGNADADAAFKRGCPEGIDPEVAVEIMLRCELAGVPVSLVEA